jgi:hypothetical protein
MKPAVVGNSLLLRSFTGHATRSATPSAPALARKPELADV